MKLQTAFKKLSSDATEKLLDALGSKEFTEISKMDESKAEENGRFRFKITSETVDRSGDVIQFDGWNTKFFEENPVVLWSHSYSHLPVGKATKLEKNADEKTIYMEGVFADHAQAQDIRKLYDGGFLNACSVGFIPEDFEKNDNGGYTITQAQLLEVSICAVPCNQEALSSLAVKEFDITNLVSKNLILVKQDEEDEETDENETEETEVVEEETETAEEDGEETTDGASEEEKGCPCEEDHEQDQDDQEDEEVDEEKAKRIRKVLAGVDQTKLNEALEIISGIKEAIDESDELEDEEEEVEEDGEEDVEGIDEKYLETKKITQSVSKALDELLHECRKAKT